MCGLFEELGGECERQGNSVIITAANTDTQIIRPPWTLPAAKSAVLEMLIVSNQNTTTEAIVKLFDAELVTAGTPGVTIPPVRGTAAAPLLPFINVPANTQVWVGKNECPNIPILGGLACQVTQQPVHIYAQVVVY